MVKPVMTMTPVSEEEVEAARARGESVVGEARRIHARSPEPRHADLIATVSRYGERLVIPRQLAYAIGHYVREGRPWAVAANAYWGGGTP